MHGMAGGAVFQLGGKQLGGRTMLRVAAGGSGGTWRLLLPFRLGYVAERRGGSSFLHGSCIGCVGSRCEMYGLLNGPACESFVAHLVLLHVTFPRSLFVLKNIYGVISAFLRKI